MEITKESLRKTFSDMDSDELVALHEGGTRTDDAMDVIESILAERGISFASRNEIFERLVDQQSELTDSYASIGSRIVAQFIDSLLALVVAIPLTILVAPIIGFPVLFIYLLFQDGLPNGQSFGKRFLKIAVVDKTTRSHCTFWKSFARNILLLILGFIDWLFIFGESRQRLGDKVANTIVIKAQSRLV